jgi:hypothetical protein
MLRKLSISTSQRQGENVEQRGAIVHRSPPGYAVRLLVCYLAHTRCGWVHACVIAQHERVTTWQSKMCWKR